MTRPLEQLEDAIDGEILRLQHATLAKVEALQCAKAMLQGLHPDYAKLNVIDRACVLLVEMIHPDKENG